MTAATSSVVAVRPMGMPAASAASDFSVAPTLMLVSTAPGVTAFNVARCVGVESEMELAFSGLHDLCAPMLSYLDALVEPQREALSVALGLAAAVKHPYFQT